MANNKRELGAFYTVNVDEILNGFEKSVIGKTIIDPFAGDGDLLDWATRNGAGPTTGMDVNGEAARADECRNTLLQPPDYTVYDVVIMNPPYLLRNKAQDKEPFDMWELADLYKISLKSVIEYGANEGIAIVPFNLFVDKDYKFRSYLFSKIKIDHVETFDKQMFPDTNVRVCAFHWSKGVTTHVLGWKLHECNIGSAWYKRLKHVSNIHVGRLRRGDQPNTYMNVRTTDTGSKGGEIQAFMGAHYYGKLTDRNLCTLKIGEELSEAEQQRVVRRFNDLLNYYRSKYDSLFLTNFLAGRDHTCRKRIAFADVYKLINSILTKGDY